MCNAAFRLGVRKRVAGFGEIEKGVPSIDQGCNTYPNSRSITNSDLLYPKLMLETTRLLLTKFLIPFRKI